MSRRFLPRKWSVTPQYFLYLSDVKISMLYPQIPQRLARSLEAEIRANIGVLQASIRGGRTPDPEDIYARTAVVSNYLEKHDKVGTVAQPERYIKDTATLRYGIVAEYASDIAFFGGSIGSTKVGLIGSSYSIIGEAPRSESGHSPFYYTLRFLNRVAEDGSTTRAQPEYFSYAQAFDIASAAASLTTKAEFLAKTLYQEPGLIIATPLYVATVE